MIQGLRSSGREGRIRGSILKFTQDTRYARRMTPDIID
jgi:hypothetical protein